MLGRTENGDVLVSDLMQFFTISPDQPLGHGSSRHRMGQWLLMS